MLALLTTLIGRLFRTASVTDFSDAQRIGGRDGSRPACADWSKHLHQ